MTHPYSFISEFGSKESISNRLWSYLKKVFRRYECVRPGVLYMSLNIYAILYKLYKSPYTFSNHFLWFLSKFLNSCVNWLSKIPLSVKSPFWCCIKNKTISSTPLHEGRLFRLTYGVKVCN